MRKEIYISLDVETDGTIPGPYSMSSFGAAVAGSKTKDGTLEQYSPTEENTFYTELKPISDNFIPETAAVSGLDRNDLILNGEDPKEAMNRFYVWVKQMQEKYEASGSVLIGYPVVFDWLWLYWYLMTFSDEGSPFGFSRVADAKTTYSVKSNALIIDSVKSRMPKHLMSKRRHTHNGLDDAIEQGEMYMNLLRWEK